MHAVAIKTELVERYPWLAESIFNAYSEAKKQHYGFMRKYGWVFDSLPWYGQELEETKKLMGENFWSYGIESNRKTLETLFRYSYEQGLSKKKLSVEDLFHYSSLKFMEKEGKLSGTISEASGYFIDVELKNFKYDGKTLNFEFMTATPPDDMERNIRVEFDVLDDFAGTSSS